MPRRRGYYLIILGAGVIVIDQLLKLLIPAQLLTAEFFITKNEFFSAKLIVVHNPYLAFGIPLPSFVSTAILLVAIVILLLLLKKYFIEQKTGAMIALTMIISAALSNILDRISRGAVVDYLTLSLYNFEWATFNLADVFITGGVIILVMNELQNKKPKL